MDNDPIFSFVNMTIDDKGEPVENKQNVRYVTCVVK